VDYSSGHPGGAALKAAGKTFAARYVSHTPSKNISLAEANDLAAHGVSTVLVWETTASRAAGSRAAGAADAKEAAQQATAAGMPSGRPIYFAVDWDANPSVVVAYFQGVASVLGLARTGVYGGYKVVRYLLDHKLVGWAWQTVAWSNSQWDTRAVIRQFATTVRINGVSCDLDTATAADYGQWMPGKTPLVEDDMPTPQDVAKAVMEYKIDDPTRPGTQYMAFKDVFWWVGAHSGQAAVQITALSAAVTALTAQLGKDVDTATVVAAVQKAVADAVVKVDVNVTGPTA
jgi:hypothetical protein